MAFLVNGHPYHFFSTETGTGVHHLHHLHHLKTSQGSKQTGLERLGQSDADVLWSLTARLLITMGSGSSAQAYQLTAEEAVECWEVHPKMSAEKFSNLRQFKQLLS